MSFTPDLLVATPDGGSYALVVEVKKGEVSPGALEQLKRYMISMRCPVALVVTSQSIELFRDSYTDFTPEAIVSVGRYATPQALAASSVDDAVVFERAVQTWIEQLRRPGHRVQLAPDLRQAVEEYVLPALADSEVAAGRPHDLHVRAS